MVVALKTRVILFMKKQIRILLASLLVALPVVLAPAVVMAENSSKADGQTDTNSTNETPEQELSRLTTLEDKKDTREQRLKTKIAELKIKLTVAQIALLKKKCVGAQTNVKALETKVDGGVTARSKAYSELLDHLDSIIVKLKAANVSTTDLEKERATLDTKITTFKTDLAKYKVALADARGMSCTADPASFKAALEASRAARVVVAADAVAIRSYVTDTIKPTLKAIADDLDATKSTDTTEGNR